MSDGSRLRQSWYTALNEAEAHFRELLTSPAAEWRRLSHSADVISAKQKGKGRVSSVPELADVVVHRSTTKSGEDVYRIVLDVPTGDEQVSLESWKAVLTTPELRQEWDPAVEDAHLLEMFDRNTRISKTHYSLGWPASPRDSITISRAFYDATTLIDITTSLPRSPDEPAYLRPSPPFVRSHVNLFAWCIQYIQPQPPSPSDKKSSSGGRIRITCFWQHDLKALWGFGSSTATLTQQLSTMTLSLLKTVMKRGGRVPKLVGYGNGISIERVRYQIDREALTVDYAIIPDDEEHHELGLQGMDEVHALREHRRLTRSIECILPSLEGWDVLVTMKGSSEEVEKIPWSAHATRTSSSPLTSSSPDQVLLRLTHGALTDEDAVLKVKVVIEVSGGTRGLRLNGLQTKIHDLGERDPSSYAIPQKMLQDVASAVDLSIQTSSSFGTVSSTASSSNGLPRIGSHPQRSPAAEKSILSKVRRNYIYFSSLLQEPEAKWKRTTEARGVSITQLDSIDPTLVVYRAEATFVGVGLWDLFGAVVSPGARAYWDKQHEDGTLLEHVNELTELWHFKTKPAWPVHGRDSVVLKTVYKSPTTIHVFSFSAEDPHLFPHIPPVDLNYIRTQVDLQGWAIEALSPTTTLLTLLEQSDPKGWTNKASIPTTMISALAGIGEFVIKCGGPPIVTRMSGAKANELRYDHERGTFKVEYEPCANRNSGTSTSNGSSQNQDDSGLPAIECEIRCDLDTWAASLDIVVDPPPQTITCLRRHRLSSEGGGLWLTLSHDAIFLDDERLLVLVRRAPGKEKGLVMVNGAKVQVDVEELPDHEIKTLSRQKRVKPPRIPLDQPPVMGVIRRRKAELSGAESEESGENKGDATKAGSNSTSSAPKISSPLSRFFTYAVDQATTTTQQAVAAIAPANAAGGSSGLDPAKPPMQYALEALSWTQDFNSQPFTQEGWTMIGEKGLVVQRKLIPEISPLIPVHRGHKVIEGVSAEELASVITEYDCRKTWDEKFDSARILQSYGGQARTTFLVAKGGFPFRDRGFYLASIMAREHFPSSGSVNSSRGSAGDMADHSPMARNAIFCVSASFSSDSESVKSFSAAKYNPYGLPIGRVYLDAWILETLDPYTKENYAIPSARCTRLVAVDYAGSIPAALNSMINATLARGVLAVETFMQSGVMKAALPITRLPSNGLVVSERKDEEEERGAGSSTVVLPGVEAEGSTSARVDARGWKLKNKDENRVLLETRFDVEKKVYRSSVLVSLPPKPPAQSHGRGREASSATVVNVAEPTSASNPDSARSVTPTGAHDKESASSSTALRTPRQGRLALESPSPHRGERDGQRQRRLSDASSPETVDSAGSESTLAAPDSRKYLDIDKHEHDSGLDSATLSSSPSSGIAMTPLPMPGSMVITPSPGPTASSPHNPKTAPHIRASTSVSPTRPPLFPHGQHTRQTSSSVALPNSPPRMRQRAASSGAGSLSVSGHLQSPSYFASPPSSPPSSSSAASPAQLPVAVRGRTTSAVLPLGAAFKAKVRPREGGRDLVVMEVVVDSRMFGGSGKGYKVDVRARRRDALQVAGGAVGLSKLNSDSTLSTTTASASATTSAVATASDASPSISSSNSTSSTTANASFEMPFITALYTLPSSPLHSSSLSEYDGPGDARSTRHLIRVSLPTWKYQYWKDLQQQQQQREEEEEKEEEEEGGWADPLMLRSPPASEKARDKDKQEKEKEKEKESQSIPEWLTLLETTGVLVDLTISPLSLPGPGPGPGSSSSSSSLSIPTPSSKASSSSSGVVVSVNGEERRVLSEQESLSSLGREELVDDRVGRMGVLVRTHPPSQSEAANPSPSATPTPTPTPTPESVLVPEALKAPMGVADDLMLLAPPARLGGGTSDADPLLLGGGKGEGVRGRGLVLGVEERGKEGEGEGRIDGEFSGEPNRTNLGGSASALAGGDNNSASRSANTNADSNGNSNNRSKGNNRSDTSNSNSDGNKTGASTTSTGGYLVWGISLQDVVYEPLARFVGVREGVSRSVSGGGDRTVRGDGEGEEEGASGSLGVEGSSASASAQRVGQSSTATATGTATGTGTDIPETTAKGTAPTTAKDADETQNPETALGVGSPRTQTRTGSRTRTGSKTRTRRETRTRTRTGTGTYPLSTVLLVGLMAFLMGSLLRSLLSPADFMYVVSPAPAPALGGREVEGVVGGLIGGAGVGGGIGGGEGAGGGVGGGAGGASGGSGEWREIRRLLEIKYLVWGWDFQVAVVRRH